MAMYRVRKKERKKIEAPKGALVKVTWKRDKTSYVKPLTEAVEDLIEFYPTWEPQDIANKLWLEGQILETRYREYISTWAGGCR